MLRRCPEHAERRALEPERAKIRPSQSEGSFPVSLMGEIGVMGLSARNFVLEATYSGVGVIGLGEMF